MFNATTSQNNSTLLPTLTKKLRGHLQNFGLNPEDWNLKLLKVKSGNKLYFLIENNTDQELFFKGRAHIDDNSLQWEDIFFYENANALDIFDNLSA